MVTSRKVKSNRLPPEARPRTPFPSDLDPSFDSRRLASFPARSLTDLFRTTTIMFNATETLTLVEIAYPSALLALVLCALFIPRPFAGGSSSTNEDGPTDGSNGQTASSPIVRHFASHRARCFRLPSFSRRTSLPPNSSKTCPLSLPWTLDRSPSRRST
jgi:hypothetical protein